MNKYFTTTKNVVYLFLEGVLKMVYTFLGNIFEVEHEGKKYHATGFNNDFILMDGNIKKGDKVELKNKNNVLVIKKYSGNINVNIDGVITLSQCNEGFKDDDVLILCEEYQYKTLVDNKVVGLYNVLVATKTKINNFNFSIGVAA